MFPGGWELIIILGIVVIIFGASRLKNIGRDLGSAIKGFRTAVKEDPDKEKDANESQTESSTTDQNSSKQEHA